MTGASDEVQHKYFAASFFISAALQLTGKTFTLPGELHCGRPRVLLFPAVTNGEIKRF